MSTFDIFLVPAETQNKTYSEILKSLAKNYRTPSFPHVTLFELVEADEKELVAEVEKVAGNTNKLEVEMFGMNFTNTVHQCVFAQVKMSAQLLSLYEKTRTALDFQVKQPFFPHMSMVYGDFPPQEKAELAGKIEIEDSILLDKIVIYRDGPVATDWAKLAEFTLN